MDALRPMSTEQALARYRFLSESECGDCVDCGAHEEQVCEFDCLTRRLATETDLDEIS